MSTVSQRRVVLRTIPQPLDTAEMAAEMLRTASNIKQKHTSLEVALLSIGEVHASRLHKVAGMLEKTELLLFQDDILEDLPPVVLVNLVNSLKADLHASTKEIQSITKSIDADDLEAKVVISSATDSAIDAEVVEFSEVAADLLRDVAALQ